ncbi:lysyl oxidase homolog 2A-like isoform X2 [Asterias amurensis]|uniref:lysyl oxidase homolog 2A-like isoform X2 n=1 Tax=Asterias amurensis TaxID=7602 RepID=UPI003AB65E6C
MPSLSDYVTSHFVCLSVALIVVSSSVIVTEDPPPKIARLVGGQHPWEGRLEVYNKKRKEYGTVCDDGWHMNASQVACRMLGYAEALNFHYGNVFGAGSGKVLLDDVRCTGNETTLFQCKRAKMGKSDCHHSEDIGLTCSNDTIGERMEARRAADRKKIRVRLRGRSTLQPISEGVVEMFYKGKWRTACADGWDIHDATVVCGRLGYKQALPLSSRYVEDDELQRRKSMKFTNFGCVGSEVLIGSCPFDDLESFTLCESEAVAHVRCHRGSFVIDTPYEDDVDVEELDRELEAKLDGVAAADENEKNETMEAEVVDEAAEVVEDGTSSNTTETEEGTEEPQVFNKLGKEALRTSKKARRTYSKHGRKRPRPNIRLRAGGNFGEGRVEVYIKGIWGTICSESWDLTDASVACKQLGFGAAKEIVPNSGFGQGVGPIWLWKMQCRGHERSLTACNHGYYNSSSCTHSLDAGVRCIVPDINVKSHVKLEGGTYEREGRVSVLLNGEWANVCGGTEWGLLDAKVICRQMGMDHARYAIQSTLSYGAAPKRNIMMLDVQCTGKERTIRECKYSRRSQNNTCYRGFRAGVVCVEYLPDVLMDLHVLQSSVRIQDWPDSLMTCSREEGCLSDVPNRYGLRRLLRFTSAIMNRGMEQFRPVLNRYSWIWHSCHMHYHSMEIFSHYDLMNRKNERVAQGHKASFCLEDGHCDDGIQPQFSCNSDQGISVNCIDIYASNIDCQWVDITGVKMDLYTLRIHVNPDNLVAETDYENNLIECDLYYGGTSVVIGHCVFVADKMED